MKRVGSRLEVWKGKATRTSGGLTKGQLTVNKRKKIVSKKASGVAHRKSNLKGFLASKAAKHKPKLVWKPAAKPKRPIAKPAKKRRRGKYERETEEDEWVPPSERRRRRRKK